MRRRKSPIRGQTIAWRPGRYGKRLRSYRIRRNTKPRPVMDSVYASFNGLVGAGVVLYLGIVLFNATGLPLYITYGAALPLVALACVLLAPRGRTMLILSLPFAVLWIAGTLFLYVTRHDMNRSPHNHPSSAASAQQAAGPVERRVAPPGRSGPVSVN